MAASRFSHRLVLSPILIAAVTGCVTPELQRSHLDARTENFQQDPFPAATPSAVVAVTERIFPAVVRLDVAQERYKEGKRSLERSIGSGVIIDDEGRILTNFHVAGRAAEIFVTLFNKERVPAKVVGDDHWSDLAVVQMDMETVRKKGIKFRSAEMGDSSGLLTGQDVMAIGTPFGLARTTTLGIVSNTDRTFYPGRQMIDEYETGDFFNWVQMDTPIAQGNSGGPLVDMNGRVVGINTRGIPGQSLNFAIPINVARDVARAIMADAATDDTGKMKGQVHRSDLGLVFKPLNELESFYDIDINQGVLINSVERGSAAAKAGVRTQDILMKLDGQPINVRFPEELAAARKRIADLPIGSDVTLTLKRGKETLDVKVQTQALEGAVGEERELKVWGLSVRDVTRSYANDNQLNDDEGAVVTTTTPGYPAARAELQEGDVIRSINGQPVTDLNALGALYATSVEKKENRVLIEVTRNRGARSVVLRVTY
ncbi:MAG TPA: trypsin-like peptidase domain-containing protein [Tepidisphaeraceae bacterium]|jgi:serine protease Do|nr:trypsin-like peptidase domain-containing protein [Tepidisphaeraceae bacterium]